jgi:hypothetical protein
VSAAVERILVRAPVGLVYATLTDVDGWHIWWRGCHTSRLTAPSPSVAVDPDAAGAPDDHLVTFGVPWRRRRLIGRAHRWRHDEGVLVDLRDRRGREVGTSEWWLEGCPDGTVVHHVLHGGRDDAAGVRRRERHRRAVRSGLQDLKDHLELSVEVALGRVP